MASSPSFSAALLAAQHACGSQHYPQGALYVTATPIGNLADISLRALHVLHMVDAIACEDTRHTQQLLRAYGMDRPASQLLAVHQHNEAQAAQAIVQHLRRGKRMAYVSDAGTPGLSDPGARLVAAVQNAGLRCIPLPGASSATALLSVGGASTGHSEPLHQGFVFAGFLPAKGVERNAFVQQMMHEPRAIIVLEAPHRIEALAAALQALGKRTLTIGREITKQFEEIATLHACDMAAWLQASPLRSRGEFSLLIHPTDLQNPPRKGERVLQLLLAELPLKTAVRLAAEISGEHRNALYERALQIRNESRADGVPRAHPRSSE